MKVKSAIYLAIFLMCWQSLFSQRPVEYDYPNSIQTWMDEAVSCLKTEQESCHLVYQKALDQAFSMNDPELLGNLYAHIINTYRFMQGPPDELDQFINQGIHQLRGSNEHASLCLVYRGKAEYLQLYSPSEPVILYLDTALSYGNLAKDFELISTTYAEIARAYENEGDMNRSIENLVLAKDFAHKSENQEIISISVFGLGVAHAANEDYQLADDYYKQTLNILWELKDTARYYYAMTNWCHNLISLERFQQSIDSLKEVINYSQTKGQKIVVPFAQSQLSRAYFFQKQYDLAINEAQKSLDRCEELRLDEQKSYNQMLLSQCYFEKQENQTSLEYSSLAFNYSRNQPLSVDQIEVYENHAKILEANNQFKEAVTTYKVYLQKKDSIFNEEKMKQVTSLQGLLELEEKENELCSKEGEINLLEAKNETARNRNIALVIGLLLIAVAGYALLNRQKLKTLSEKALVEKKALENQQLNSAIDYKNRELTSNALNLARKNQFLSEIDNKLANMADSEDISNTTQSIRNMIKIESKMEENWSVFTDQFKKTNPTFYKNLTEKYADLSKNELRMAALIRMKIPSKDIAHMLNISDEGVKKARYRMRKKFSLEKQDSLENHIFSLS